MSLRLIGAALLAIATAVFLATFWWERDFLCRAIKNQMDIENTSYRRTLEDLQFERHALEWVRVLSAFGMLAGVLLQFFK
ncbi:hypothetical protein FTO74_18440 [Granulicella sp. WH15]|uniref:hypothetical protein n=1 Tax=Granulicella sp. WH15 TaxID=2602070 RepID=UPI0013671919|nr:hypothetical protein [Granulicella sp. WH15]QHN05103.1 hypothetical protein FTO74_18440 [Granulicella sp. WH15]